MKTRTPIRDACIFAAAVLVLASLAFPGRTSPAPNLGFVVPDLGVGLSCPAVDVSEWRVCAYKGKKVYCRVMIAGHGIPEFLCKEVKETEGV